MRTLLLALVASAGALASVAVAEPTAGDPPRARAPADPARAEGHLESGRSRVELLGRPARVGEDVELPEGYLRVEEAGVEDRRVGSFTVIPADRLRATAAALAAPAGAVPDGAGGPAAARREPEAPPAPARCREERAAYLRELWKQAGIEDVRDPDAVIEGLGAGAGGPATGYYWFAFATDAFRPLAWSSDLRGRADALARCVRGR